MPNSYFNLFAIYQLINLNIIKILIVKSKALFLKIGSKSVGTILRKFKCHTLNQATVEVECSDGPGLKFSTRVGSIFCASDRVSHSWFGFELEKFPLKMSNFSIFSLRVKKISSGWVYKYPGQRRVSLLFTAGQKYSWVGSGPISNWIK